MYDRFKQKLNFLRDKFCAAHPVLYAKTQKKVDMLNLQVDTQLENLKKLMKSYGITGLPADEQERKVFLRKYPLLQHEYYKLMAVTEESSNIMIKNPWLWRPGQDAGMYYDVSGLQERMMKILAKETDYLENLFQQIDDLDKKIAASKNQDLQNQKFYLQELVSDAVETVGDQLNEEWWNAIPRIIKERCQKYMDDVMTEIIASDDVIAAYIKNYKKVKDDIFVSGFVLRIIEDKLNSKISKIVPPVKLFLGDLNQCTGVNDGIGDVIFDFQNMGETEDKFVDTLKHEVLGHHLDMHCPNFGIRGDTMVRFADENLNAKNGMIVCHEQNSMYLVAISPLLKQEYPVYDITKKAFKKLSKEGWGFAYSQCADAYEKYKNQMGERNAWLIGETKNTVKKIDEYRECRGLSRIGKTR